MNYLERWRLTEAQTDVYTHTESEIVLIWINLEINILFHWSRENHMAGVMKIWSGCCL